MAIATLYGNLTPTEKIHFKVQWTVREMVHMARTKMIQEVYAANSREHLEELVGAKLVNLFSDMKVEEDIAVSVFCFDKKYNVREGILIVKPIQVEREIFRYEQGAFKHIEDSIVTEFPVTIKMNGQEFVTMVSTQNI